MTREIRNLIAFILAIILMSWPVLAAAQSRWRASPAYKYCLDHHLDSKSASVVFLSWFGPAKTKYVAKISFKDQAPYFVAVVSCGSHFLAFDPLAEDLDFERSPKKAVEQIYRGFSKIDLLPVKAVAKGKANLLKFHDD